MIKTNSLNDSSKISRRSLIIKFKQWLMINLYTFKKIRQRAWIVCIIYNRHSFVIRLIAQSSANKLQYIDFWIVSFKKSSRFRNFSIFLLDSRLVARVNSKHSCFRWIVSNLIKILDRQLWLFLLFQYASRSLFVNCFYSTFFNSTNVTRAIDWVHRACILANVLR